MSAALLFFASGLAAPAIGEGLARTIQAYYPEWALERKAQASSILELTTLPDGTINACRVVEHIGSERLAAEQCSLFVGRRADPATDDGGNAAHAIVTIATTMGLTAPGVTTIASIEPQPQIEIQVARLPDGAERLDTEVVVLLSPEGQVAACEAHAGAKEPAPTAFTKVACGQAQAWRGAVLKDLSGAAIPYVTNLRVRFSQGAES
jgi:Gram-negative bacterial tonB protein.